MILAHNLPIGSEGTSSRLKRYFYGKSADDDSLSLFMETVVDLTCGSILK